jgi:hypothetical protein
MLGVLGLTVLQRNGFLSSGAQGSSFSDSRVGLITDGMLFAGIAIAVAAPWYVKNWLLLGNPFYPLWFGGREWDAYQAANLATLGTRYGLRDGLLGLLLLPWDLYFHSVGYFGPIPFAFPPPMSLLLPSYLFVRHRRSINLILFVVALRFVTWAISARNARYLMDLFPLLSIAVAHLVLEMSRRRVLQLLFRAGLFLLVVANLAWHSALLVQEDPLPVVLGMETREQYLSDHNAPYRTIQFINQLPDGSKVLFVGNGQSYYVTTEHVADVNHATWGHLIYQCRDEPEDLLEELLSQGFTHIYYSGYDYAWQLNFDAGGEIARELTAFKEFAAQCTCLIHDRGENGQVFELSLTCREGPTACDSQGN